MQAGKYRKEIFKCLSSRKVPPDLFYVFSSQYAKTGFGTMKGKARDFPSYFRLSTTATSTTTVAPTAGLLPIEIRRFIRQKPTVLFFFSPLFKSFSHLSVSFFIPTFFITLLLFFSGWQMVDNSQLLSQLPLFIANHHHRLR